jgi:hypothetical protein
LTTKREKRGQREYWIETDIYSGLLLGRSGAGISKWQPLFVIPSVAKDLDVVFVIPSVARDLDVAVFRCDPERSEGSRIGFGSSGTDDTATSRSLPRIKSGVGMTRMALGMTVVVRDAWELSYN